MNPIYTFSPDELQAYTLALKLLAAAFYLPPSAPFLATLDDGELLAEWPLAPDSPLTEQGLALLRAGVASAPAAELLPHLRSDYTGLFVGLEQVGAPPWESVYLSREHLLFDVQTLAVREFYARFDLQIPKLEREPDDHIGFELLFLAHLLEGAGGLLADGQIQPAQARLQAAQAFLAAHPQQWAEQFAARVRERAQTDYYRGWACLLLGSLAGLVALLTNAGAPPAAATASSTDGAAA